ncbi:MAG: OmpA family protein [Thermodesulfobacteriota bacterium]
MKTKQGRPTAGKGEHGSFLLHMMTISLFVILLAFFILLNAIAVVDERRVAVAVGSLLGSFRGDSGEYVAIDGMGGAPRLVTIQTESGIMDFSGLFVQADKWTQEISIRKDFRGTVISIPTADLFEPHETRLKNSGQMLLGRLCRILRENDYPIEIMGHTDDLASAEGRRITNRELSALQAVDVLRYCIQAGGVSPQRLLAYGWGSRRPLYPHATGEARGMNRRLDILVVHPRLREKPKSGFTFKRFFFRSFE